LEMDYYADDNKMRIYEERLASFKNWPFTDDENCTPDKVYYETPLIEIKAIPLWFSARDVDLKGCFSTSATVLSG
jgi:hypothetical protein